MEKELAEFLKKIRLGQFQGGLYEEGVECVEDLQDVDFEALTRKIKMKDAQANRLIRTVQEKFPMALPPRIQQPSERAIIKKIEDLYIRRAALEFQYQLLTNSIPERKRLRSFNTDQILYCELVNIICNQERNELGEDMTVELYTCEGYPLATRPISYISKLSDWCLEAYPDTPLLYAVPRLKCYTDKCTQYMTAAPLCDGTDSIFIRNEECEFYIQIQTNCKQATYFQLIKRLQNMTNIPGHLIQLYFEKDFNLNVENVKLDELNIRDRSVLTLGLKEHFWTLGKEKTFSFQECKPTWHLKQSKFGSSLFFSCLYSLADWMAQPQQNSSGTSRRTLGHIRSIIEYPPLIHSLNLMFINETLTLPHRVAIQECLIMLFKMIEPKTPKLHLKEFEVMNFRKLTEFSNYFWVYLIHYSTPGHLQTEQYSTLNLTCSETLNRLNDPVLVQDKDGMEHIVDRKTMYEEIIEDRPSKLHFRYLYDYRRLIKSFIGNEAIVWKCTAVPTCGVELTREWGRVIDLCSNFPALCVQSPMNIKSLQCPMPCMIPNESGNISVYTSTSLDIEKPFIYYEVFTGLYIGFDVKKLDEYVKSNPHPSLGEMIELKIEERQSPQVITCDPEEIIMVILDTSGSMESCYLDGKTKFDSVLEAFLAFCDRTEAYHFKHLIGLTLFAQNCILQYAFSENFKGFANQFGDYPIGNSTAIYDAIKFAIDQFSKFMTENPELKDFHKRILCLTDGGDNNSNITATKATRLLINNNVKMDSVLLCEKKVEIHAIAKASGGFSFKPTNSQEMLKFFEQETMLSMESRQDRNASYAAEDTIDLSIQAILPVDIQPRQVLPERINIKVQTTQKCLTRAVIRKQLNTHINTDLAKRIIKELSYYQTNPHPAFEVFPGEEHIDFWRIIMKGPEGTPYEGGIFELFIEFINEYPAKPPNIRFITPIYHCNINSSGRICHTILDRFYGPGVRIGEIFNHVYGLLSSPEHQDPLDSVKANLLRFQSDQYFREARQHTNIQISKRTLRDVRIALLGEEQNVDINYSSHLICPLTLQLFIDPVTTLSGETYEREAILEHLRSGKNYDPFTFLELHEHELAPNVLVKKLVSEYKKEVAKEANI